MAIASWFHGFTRDLRYACRGFRKSPGFTAAAVVTLALGIGATTAIFSVVNAMLLEPLPFAHASRLVFVWSDMTSAGYPRGPLSGPELDDLRRRTSLFDGFAAIWATTATLTGDGDPQMLRVGLATDDFFPLIGAPAALGHSLGPDDQSDAAPSAILLSAGLWQRRFGSDPGIVGRRIVINGQPITVAGVMPAGFRTYLPPDAGVPDDLEAFLLFNRNVVFAPRGQMFLRVVGRLREGVSFDAARAEVTAVAAQISREFTDYGSAGRVFTVVGFQSDGVRSMRPVLLALFGGVVTLMLVAIVNVVGLLVARAAARARESAVQVALGASRGRMFSQYLAEGAVLSLAGAAAGVLTALAGVRLLVLTRPENLGRIDNTSVDTSVLAVTASLAFGVALIFSLAPMSEMLRSRLVTALQHGARGGGAQTHRRLRSVLVVVQLALAVVLLVSAALFVRTFRALQLVDPGFRAEGVLSFRIGLPPRLFGKQEVFNTFSRELQSKLSALPGITHVGAISHLPYDNVPNWSTNYLTQRGEDDSQARRADARAVTPGFFEAAGAQLVAGRAFTEQDDVKSRPVAIVDDSLARRVWPAGDAVGKEIAVDPRVTGHPAVWVTIVGVVAHIRHLSLTEEVREQVYFPVRQVPRNPMAYMVRTRADAAALTTQVRAALDALDPQVPIYDVRPLGDSVATAMATQRFTMRLASVFALVALCMACVGVYGVMAYSVAKRRVEFGVRLALGARPRSVVALVVREGAMLALVGLALGIVAAFNVTTLLASQLYGVTARDAASYVAVVPVLAVAAVVACWLPALRATRANPIDALRAE